MTDKEKIEQIMLDKQLNNTQFSSMIGISAGALSHITSGRSNPSLTILRNIKDAFPDLNPKWLFYDEGEMYLSTSDGTGGGALEGGETGNDAMGERGEAKRPAFQTDLFDTTLPNSPQNNGARTPQMRVNDGSQGTNQAFLPRNGMANTEEMKEMIKSVTEMVNIKDIVEQSVAQTVNPIRQNQRKITEVRVFFDDGTYETFFTKQE